MITDTRFPNNILDVFVDITPGTTNSTGPAPCPYAPVISAHVMRCLRAAPVDDTSTAGLRELENCGLTGSEYSAVKQTVKGKFVLYGTELHGLGDIYDVPIHDGYRLSGIFIHAMALDNLLETGGNVHYVKDKRAGFPATLYYVFSAFLATLVFLAIKFAFFDLWHCIVECAHGRKSLRLRTVWLVLEFGFWMLAVISAAAALMFLAWVSYLLGFLYEPFRFGILNWVGILLVSGLLSVWVKIPFAFELARILELFCEKLCAAMGCHKSSTEQEKSGPEGKESESVRTPAK